VRGKYKIELFREGGEQAGIERVLVQHHSLAISRALYKAAVKNNPERLVTLSDNARILARSDQPETMPATTPAKSSSRAS
jgi:hypothetical protein